MIKALTATNFKGEALRMELANPDPSGLIIKQIEGLGPPKATINTSELATIDGSLFASSRCQNRNIVITLAMMFKPTIEDSRQKTYKYFPIKKPLILTLETDNRLTQITGYVESNEPNIFSSEEDTQISIICPDPFFYDLGSSEQVYTNIYPLFEFPFSNESLTENLIEFSTMIEDPRAIINYIGDIDTGIEIRIHSLDTPGDITLYNVETRESFKIFNSQVKKITGGEIGNTDDIIISTKRGNKYVKLFRKGIETNIISAVDMDADWFQLSTGVNAFTFVTQKEKAKVTINFSYRNAYGGI